MGFENIIKQYGYMDFPIVEGALNPVPTYSNFNFTLDGKQRREQVAYYTFLAPQWITPIPQNGITTATLPNDTILACLKSKTKEIYIIWYLTNNKSTLKMGINTRLSLSGIQSSGSFNAFNRNTAYALYKNAYGIYFGYTDLEYNQTTLTGISNAFIENILGEIDSDLYSPEYGTPSGSGGYSGGSFDNSSDTIAIPNKPSIGVTNVGFVNVYNPSASGLINLGSELFPDFTPPQPAPLSADITEALQLGFNNVVENITNFTNMFINSKLIDYVIDCHVIPIKPTVTESENIKIGFKSFNQTASKVTSDYIDFDCGTLNIKEYYTNFIDYVGTRAKLYLPFVGFVPIENEYFQNGILNVKYRFNVIDGSFMCYVLSSSSKSELKNSVIASYGGNACVHIPITGLNYSNMITGIASGTVATIATASIGGGLASKALSPALASAGVAVGTLNSALNTLATKPSMQSSNGYNATSAYLGVRYPYLVIEREVSNFSEYYTSENGLPCNITKTINELSGYIEMDNIHMETLTCTDEEKTLIENLLKSGIIV